MDGFYYLLFFYAAECGSYDMVKILAVDHKAKVNVQDKTKQTPCHIAAYNGDLDIVECLVENGADLKLKDEDGVTILEYAQEEGHKDIVPPENSQSILTQKFYSSHE